MYSEILCRAQAGKSFKETDDSIKLSCSDTIINNMLCWFTVNYAMLKKLKVQEAQATFLCGMQLRKSYK